MVKIIPIPALKDNYIWLIKSMPSIVAAVDPGEAGPVLSQLKDQNLQLGYILITHHHWDHTNGITELLEHYPGIPVYGPANEKVAGVNQPLHEGDKVELDAMGLTFNVLEIPGHTLGHIAYYNDESLFCGDTLFLNGCGRLFEGTAQQMYSSLSKLKQLRDETMIYCAHEYTQANLQFSLRLEPNHPELIQRLKTVDDQIQEKKPTIPIPMGLEKRCNPFLRCDEKNLGQTIINKMKVGDANDPLSVFTQLRKYKDNY